MINMIFLDMDGVLVDLEGGLRKAGLHEADYDRDEFWAKIAHLGTDFWANLDPYLWTSELVLAAYKTVGQANVFILSAPSRTCDPVCSGKFMWLRKCLPEFVDGGRVIFAKQKHLLAAPGRLLIDDKRQNCEDFYYNYGHAWLFHPLKGIEPARTVNRLRSLQAGDQSAEALFGPGDLNRFVD